MFIANFYCVSVETDSMKKRPVAFLLKLLDELIHFILHVVGVLDLQEGRNTSNRPRRTPRLSRARFWSIFTVGPPTHLVNILDGRLYLYKDHFMILHIDLNASFFIIKITDFGNRMCVCPPCVQQHLTLTHWHSSQMRKAPSVASSWLSWMSTLITCTDWRVSCSLEFRSGERQQMKENLWVTQSHVLRVQTCSAYTSLWGDDVVVFKSVEAPSYTLYS